MQLPLGNSNTNTQAYSAKDLQRQRVRSMLRDVRKHQLEQLSTPIDHSTGVASVLQTGATAASAYAFGDSPSSHSKMSSAPDIREWSQGKTSASDIAALTASIAAFTLLFVVLGKYIDSALGTVLPTELHDEWGVSDSTRSSKQTSTTNNASVRANSSNSSNDHTTEPTSVLVTKIVVQVLANVAMIVVPYFVLAKYAPHTLVYRYYALVGAFWVVSLHAQQQLRNRLGRVLETDTAVLSVTEAQLKRRRDKKLLAEHVAEASRRKNMGSVYTGTNPHVRHLETIHRHKNNNTNQKMMHPNQVPQPASHPSPVTSTVYRAKDITSPTTQTTSFQEPMMSFPQNTEPPAEYTYPLTTLYSDNSVSSSWSTPVANSEGFSSNYENFDTKPSLPVYSEQNSMPMHFQSSDLLHSEPSFMASSVLGGGGGLESGLARETNIAELMR